MTIIIQWLAHSAFKIKFDNIVLYVDPRYMKKFKSEVECFFTKPDKADIILFSHHHADHCYPSSFSKMGTSKTVFVGPEGCKERIGTKLNILKAGTGMNVNGIGIKAVEAYNLKRKRSTGNLWHPKGLGIGYLIKNNESVIYHAGDTELIPEMHELGKVDVALLPIDGKFCMNIEEAITATKLINPRFVIPMHNHESDPQIFKKKLESQSTIKAKALTHGEIFQLG